MKIGLLGASFDTGNMGVGAIGESAIKCILHRWPDAQITLLDSGREVKECRLTVGGKDMLIRKMPIRFCPNIFLQNHFIVLCFYAILFKVFRGEKFRRFFAERNDELNSILALDVVADITGGDSFSDIYGMRRFTLGFLRKWIVLLFGKELIMLPQTYGPFKRRSAKAMAKFILKRAAIVYSRDKAGVECVKGLLSNSSNGKVKFSPDVAFALDVTKPERLNIAPADIVRDASSIVIGLNVSGLLFNGGYDRNNMFGLRADYPALVYGVIDFFMKMKNVNILLVPHVFSPSGTVESDPDACRSVYETLKKKYADRIFIISDKYDQGRIKYIIGMCDFFVGSRMHSCIAALSQNIPAVGIAYSSKFGGVFESIGLADCVIDARILDEKAALDKLTDIYERRHRIRKHLENTMPQVKQRVLNLFKLNAVKV